MLTQTSVVTTWAPRTATDGSFTVSKIPALGGRNPSGALIRSVNPKMGAASIQESAMFEAPSPTQAMIRPRSDPNRSVTVKRSARICTGCPPSLRPLMTGTVALFASSRSRSSPCVR